MPTPKHIFFSYSDYSKDKELYSLLNRHFSSYVRKKLISIIDKDSIFSSTASKEGAFEFLKKADLAVPLISADYLANEECFQLLKTAIAEKKDIIPVLIRDVDLDSDDELKILRNKILPEDGKSILEHFDNKEDDDIILVAVSKRIKDAAFKELSSVEIRSDSNIFYYILAFLILGLGTTASLFVWNHLHDLTISIFVFLLFLCIVFFALKHVLFPTSFKRS